MYLTDNPIIMPYQINIATADDFSEIYSLRLSNYSRFEVYQKEFLTSLKEPDDLDKRYRSFCLVLKRTDNNQIVGSVRLTQIFKENSPFEPEVTQLIPWDYFSFVDRLNIQEGHENASLYLMVACWILAQRTTGAVVALAIKKLARLYKISANLQYLSDSNIDRNTDLKEPVYLVGASVEDIFKTSRNASKLMEIISKIERTELKMS